MIARGLGVYGGFAGVGIGSDLAYSEEAVVPAVVKRAMTMMGAVFETGKSRREEKAVTNIARIIHDDDDMLVEL